MNYTDIVNQFARFIHRINDVDVLQMCNLSEGTSSATLKTAKDIVYFVGNTPYTKVATDNIAMTACAQQAISTYCYYLVSVNLSGTVTVTKGTDNTYALPSTPSGNVPIGAFKIVTDGAHTFTSGTTDLSAAGITATFYDIDAGVTTFLLNTAMRSMERKYNLSGMYIRTTMTLSAGTDTFDNPIPLYKELVDCYAKTSSGTKYPIVKGDITYVEQKFEAAETGPPSDIALVPQNETTLTPDALPTIQWMVRRIPDVDYTLVMTAYQYSPSLDGILYNSNWWTLNHPDILLYAGLVETIPYLREDDRIAIWQNRFNEKIADLIKTERSEQYSGSLQTLTADNVC